MTMNIKRVALLAALTGLSACDYVQNKEFRAERADKLYKSAMADYSAGRLDAAVDGFKKVVRANPANASARFQLACLLQDQKQDYLGALCCFRDFLLQEPGSDREKMAKERAAICEKLLITELAKKMNLTDSTGAFKGLTDARKEAESATALRVKAEQKLAEIEAKNKALSEENGRLRRMLSGVGETTEPAAAKMNIADAKAILDDADGDRLKLSPDAKKLFEAEEKTEPPKIAEQAKRAEAGETDEGPTLLTRKMGADAYKGPKLNETREAMAKPKKTEPPHEARPEFYVVQDGDTLYKLAIRFYGRRDAWLKIYNANKATISADARIRTGQKLKLP